MMRASLRLLLLLLGLQQGVRAMDETAAPGAAQESSDSYLRNVVQELQLLNGILPSAAAAAASQDQDTAASQHSYVYESPTPPPTLLQSGHSAPVRFVEPVVDRQVIAKAPSYLEDAPVRQPLVLGFTPAELASMYRKAIERGSPTRYASLMNALGYSQPQQQQQQQQSPKIIAAPLELAAPTHHNVRPVTSGESPYAYYFYPLQSFRHELVNNYGYKTMPEGIRYDSAPAENTKKETSTMNPILVGISSFLGMALFFILSMFLYPRFVHYMHFPFTMTTAARSPAGWQDELAHLTNFAIEAIDYYNKNMREKPKHSPYVVQKRKFQKRYKR